MCPTTTTHQGVPEQATLAPVAGNNKASSKGCERSKVNHEKRGRQLLFLSSAGPAGSQEGRLCFRQRKAPGKTRSKVDAESIH